jgi:hypothetical protein
VVWASIYGERCADAAAGRPAGDVTLPPDTRPKSLDGIPHTAEGMPATIEHSSDSAEAGSDDVLLVGGSRFQPVPTAVWRYDVGGKPVVRQWFGYRKREPGGRVTSELDRIIADRWSRQDTVELRELLSVLRRLTDLAPDPGRAARPGLALVQDLLGVWCGESQAHPRPAGVRLRELRHSTRPGSQRRPQPRRPGG